MTSVEEDAAQWGVLIEAQDEYVSGLLQEKASLRAALLEATDSASRPPPPASTTSDSDAAVAQAQLHSLQEYTLHLEEELKSLKEKHTQELEQTRRESARPQATQSNLANTKLGRSNRKTSSDSPAFIVVLIDGSSAPFSDGLLQQGRSGGEQAAAQVRWEIEKDLRAFDVEFDLEEVSSDTIEVLCFVYYNKAALVPSLLKAQVISSGATWDAFALAFNSSSLCYMIDIGNAPAEAKCASLINLLGPIGRLKRLYLVGLHPTSIINLLPDLGGNEETVLGRRMAGKIVAVNHRESESDRAELARFGWRVAVFSRLFSANSGLGGDWGWPVGGDDDGANGDYGGYDSYSTSEYGSPAVENATMISGKGSWREPSKDGNWKSVSSKNKKASLKINTNRGFLNQDPQICVFHYVSPTGCTQRACERSHNYDLTSAQLTRLKQDVGKSPCKELRKNGKCRWQAEHGTKCMYSHDLNGKTRSY